MEVKRICQWCGKPFIAKKTTTCYCSPQCSKRGYKHRMMERKMELRHMQEMLELRSSLEKQEYFTFSQAARLMGVSRQYIYKLVKEEKLRASRLSGKMSLIRRADIELMLKSKPYERMVPKEDFKITEYYTAEEIAQKYKVNAKWVWTYTRQHKVPKVRIRQFNYYSKKHVDEFFGTAVDMDSITDWLLTEEAEEQFGMKPAALRAYAYRHRIPTKREYGRTYYSKSHLDELRRTDLVNDERYYTVEQVRQIYGLSSANICHIVKVKHIEKIKVGVKNLLLRSDVERVMAERNK